MTVSAFHKRFIEAKQAFSTDTRSINPGDIFFALKGANFNGNAYAQQALDAGASCVVIDEDVLAPSASVVIVNDVLEFMQALATFHRLRANCPVIAIAGSNGKTTTKELLTSILGTQNHVHTTRGNLNNHIGVPITLLEMPLDTEVAVIEIGTNSFGEIAFLCNLLRPSHGIITNIGKEHLEGFGDIEGVAREESELFHYLLKNNGFAFVNADDMYLSRMAHRLPKKLTYGFTEGAQLHGILTQVSPHVKIQANGIDFSCQLPGQHNAQNLLACIAIAQHLGLSNDRIQTGAWSYEPRNNRSQSFQKGSNWILLDAYNANPSSMEAAIKTFALMDRSNKLLLLGDMFESGDNAVEEHRLILNLTTQIPNTKVITAGNLFREAGNDASNHFETTEDLITYLKTQTIENTSILIKGSRGMKMERVLEVM